MRRVGHVARKGEVYEYRVLLGKPKGRRPLREPSRRWVCNMKMDVQKVGWGMDWIYLTQDSDREQAFMN
jgi:hypothetical protein